VSQTLVLLAVVFVAATEAHSHLSQWSKQGNVQFKYFEDKRTFNGANNFCQSVGGFLAVPHNKLEFGHIQQLLPSDLTVGERAWVGFERQRADGPVESQFKTVDGSAFDIILQYYNPSFAVCNTTGGPDCCSVGVNCLFMGNSSTRFTQPNNAGENQNCLAMSRRANVVSVNRAGLNDFACTRRFSFVCMKSPAVAAARVAAAAAIAAAAATTTATTTAAPTAATTTSV